MKERKYGLLSNICYALKNIWAWDRTYLVWFFPAIPLEVLVPLMVIYFPKLLIEAVEEKTPVGRMLAVIFGYFLLLFLADTWKRFCAAKRNSRRYLINNRYELAVHEKYMRTDYANVEDSKAKGKYSRVMDDIWHSMSGENIWESLLNFFKNMLGVFTYGGVVFFASPVILLFLAASTILTWWVGRRNIRWYDRNGQNWVDLDRRKGYIASFSKNFAYAKDIRIHCMSVWLDQKYQKLEKERVGWTKRMVRADLPEALANALLSFLRDALSYGMLCSMLIGGRIGLGEFTFYFSAVAGFSSWLSSIIYGMNGLYMQGLAIGHYREYFMVQDKYRHGEGHELPKGEELPPEIEFEHVSFRYEEDGEWLFDDMNFRIRPGEKLAIVGENGAGKTTLVKLICGLYFPEKGTVRINGIPTTEFNIEDYYSLFAAVFQDIYLLPVPIRDFVASCPAGEADGDRVACAIKQAGLKEKVASLGKGADALLVKGVHLDAVELSGGENQKLMLARALYKDAPVIILDEPTAALDPVAESRLYEQYHSLTKGRTGIYISHRLASTGFCDRILFLEHGKVAEEGSHKELMALDGKYAYMYHIQSQYYQKNGQGEAQGR